MTKKRVSICIADEGFGHAVRQISFIRALIQKYPNITVTIYGDKRLSLVKERLGQLVEYRQINNLIRTCKTVDGSLDVSRTLAHFRYVVQSSDLWLQAAKEQGLTDADLVIGDSLPQIGLLSSAGNSIRTVNLSHFTWDWFWSEIEPELSNNPFRSMYQSIDHLIFSSFTPSRNIRLFNPHKLSSVGLILQNTPPPKSPSNLSVNPISAGQKVLLMNNGTRSLTSFLDKNIPSLTQLPDTTFYVGVDGLSASTVKTIVESVNIVPVSGIQQVHKLTSAVDAIVARCGYNTMSEVLAYKIPAILVVEAGNPEVSSNLKHLQEMSLCYPLHLQSSLGLKQHLIEFYENHYANLSRRLCDYTISTSGDIESADIINRILISS